MSIGTEWKHFCNKCIKIQELIRAKCLKFNLYYGIINAYVSVNYILLTQDVNPKVYATLRT